MEWLIILIIVLSIVGPIIGIIFWVLVIKAVVNHVQAFERDQRKLMDLVSRYSKQAKTGQLPPGVDQQVMNKLMSMRNHMNQMDDLRRQQYETKMTGMISSVTGAGFTNFDPGSFF
jgi:uncharacterized membrane protein YqiK